MKNYILFIAVLASISLSSCLKKIEGTDNLTTNIFDVEYTGDAWFLIDDIYTYYTVFGQLKVRVEAVIPNANMPVLKPNLIYINCHVNDEPEITFYTYKNTKGDYPFYFDLFPASSNEYCLEAGIYLQDQDTTINRFTLCGSL
jgi:hypothetical protein